MLKKETVEVINTDLLTVPEAMAYTRLSRATIYNLLRERAFASYSLKTRRTNIRGRRLISRESLDEYLRSCAADGEKELTHEPSQNHRA